MTKSQIPPESNPSTGDAIRTRVKSTPWLTALLVAGAIIILILLIYNLLFPKAFWQSRELDQNQKKWESQNITHYQMSIDSRGYGYINDRMPLKVEVRDDKIISVVDSRGNNFSPANDPDFGPYYPDIFTIQGLFSYAHKTIWDNSYHTIWEKFPSIRVTCNPDLGYPEEIFVNPYPEPCCQDLTITVRDFQVLRP